MHLAGGMMEIMLCVLDEDQDARKGLYHITLFKHVMFILYASYSACARR